MVRAVADTIDVALVVELLHQTMIVEGIGWLLIVVVGAMLAYSIKMHAV